MKITHRTVKRIYGNDRSETHYFDVSFHVSKYKRARIIEKIEHFKKDPGPEFCLSFEIKPISSGFDVNTSQTIREYEINIHLESPTIEDAELLIKHFTEGV